MQGPLDRGISRAETAIEANQAEHVLDPCNVGRSVYVDTAGTSAVDFDLSEAQPEAQLRAGSGGAAAFLRRWRFRDWLVGCRGAASGDGVKEAKSTVEGPSRR